MNEPATVLYVSRTAISKCEAGGCYPAKDSLKEIAEFYSVSIDDLLSGERLISTYFYSRQKAFYSRIAEVRPQTVGIGFGKGGDRNLDIAKR